MKRIIAYVALLALVLVLVMGGCGGGSELAGLWVGVDGDFKNYQLELNADGTGAERYLMTEFDEPMTWTVEDDELCITFEDDSGNCREFRLDGDRMSIRSTSGGSMIRLERWME